MENLQHRKEKMEENLAAYLSLFGLRYSIAIFRAYVYWIPLFHIFTESQIREWSLSKSILATFAWGLLGLAGTVINSVSIA